MIVPRHECQTREMLGKGLEEREINIYKGSKERKYRGQNLRRLIRQGNTENQAKSLKVSRQQEMLRKRSEQRIDTYNASQKKDSGGENSVVKESRNPTSTEHRVERFPFVPRLPPASPAERRRARGFGQHSLKPHQEGSTCSDWTRYTPAL